ncbi:polysaccharide biosynthesis/export family protein [Salinisphaera sp. PC39]|uniref:polysaccharide biosynthesis/export family protein n=1 Tax=Salinisphaera sp. PC39 TaxID=1304156 RepID=UPI00333FEA4F
MIVRRLLATSPALLLAACAMPGYEIEDAGSNSPWYQGSDPRARDEATVDYEPKVTKITPDMIADMKSDTGPAYPSDMPRSEEPFRYRVGPGDVLNVVVFNHPELTNPAGTSESSESSGRLVNADGMLYFPFVGEIDVAGLTLDEIRRKLAEGLSRVIRDPQVDVRVSQYRSQQVFITGDIPRPCSVPVTDLPLTILKAFDACSTLAGSEGAVGIQSVSLIRDGEAYPIDLNAMYRTGDLVHLRDGDRLIVDDGASRIFVVGEFEDQVAAPFSAGGMTLADAIAAGQGLNLETADPGAIYVIRGFVGQEPTPDGEVRTLRKPHIYHLNASSVDSLILADQFPLQPRDVVYAAPAGLVNFNRALSQITPSLNLLFQSYLIYDRRGND